MTTKVLLISDTVYDTNGVSRFIQDMAAQARETGDEFAVLTASPLAHTLDVPNIHTVSTFATVRMPYYREQFLNVIPPYLGMYRFIKRFAPDVIHISTPGPLGICAILIARRLDIPIAGTYHTDFPSYLRKQMSSKTAEKTTRWMMRRFYGQMTRVFSRSGKYLPVLEQELGLHPSKLIHLPPGSDTAKFNPAMKDPAIWAQFDVPAEAFKLLYVGRLSVEKNFMFVVDLFVKLQQKSPKKLVLIAIGEGVLDAEVRKRQIEGVHLLGVQRGVTLSKLYASSDLMLFASVTETLGQVVMEAQASAAPCIVSDRGGVTDIVADGVSGYCIDVEDEAQWLQKSLALIGDDVARAAMGQAGYARMQERSINHTFTKFMEAHQTIPSSTR